MLAAADDILSVIWIGFVLGTPVLLMAALIKWIFKKDKKPREKEFVWCNLLLATAVIIAAVCTPNNWDPRAFVAVGTLTGIFISFWAIGLVARKGLFVSFLWAFFLCFGTVVLAGLIALFSHGFGPCF